jgi:HK97 family phage major capsid protein
MTHQRKRDEAAQYIRTLIGSLETEGRQMTAEEKEKHQRAVADINEVDDFFKMKREAEELEARTKALNPLINFEEKPTRAEADFDKEMRDFVRSGKGRLVDLENRGMTTVTGSSGGFMIPEKYSNLLRSYLTTDNVIRQLATVEQWDADGAYPVVSAFGTAYLVTEGQAVTESTPTLAQKLISGFQFMYAVDVPMKLINTSQYPLEANIMKWWANTVAVLEESKFADGAGTTEPIGLIDAATQGTATAIHTALGGNDIINWYHDVPLKYRMRSSWVVADSTIKLVRQITNAVETSGALNYIWSPGLGGNPDTLMGRPIYASAGMPAFAAGEEIGVFGDISQYIIADFGAPMMIRDPFTRAKYGEVSFIGWSLTDTALPVAEAVRTLLVDAS